MIYRQADSAEILRIGEIDRTQVVKVTVDCRTDPGLCAHGGHATMPKLISVDASECSLDIYRDLSVEPRKRRPGPPERIDGMTVGFLTLTGDAPHNGEMHPDGDEILHVVSGKLRVSCDSVPDEDLILGPGDTCIVPKGEWHKVSVIEETRFIHITPGPNGDHRPLNTDDT